MEDSMIERVARAIDGSAFDEEWHRQHGINLDRMRLRRKAARKAARAAIEAMREPTEHMLGVLRLGTGRREERRKSYRRMIDIALSAAHDAKPAN